MRIWIGQYVWVVSWYHWGMWIHKSGRCFLFYLFPHSLPLFFRGLPLIIFLYPSLSSEVRPNTRKSVEQEYPWESVETSLVLLSRSPGKSNLNERSIEGGKSYFNPLLDILSFICFFCGNEPQGGNPLSRRTNVYVTLENFCFLYFFFSLTSRIVWIRMTRMWENTEIVFQGCFISTCSFCDSTLEK